MKNRQNNWQKIKLGDAAGEVRNLYNPSPGEHLKYIGLEHIKQNTLRLSSIGDSADTQSAKKFFSTNDVLFGSLRAYFRKVVKPKFNGVCSTDITVLRSKNGNDQNFLYYFIANPHFIDFAAASAEGTRMPRVSWKFLSKTQWNFPPSADQKRIASILSTFDDKIELNNKISKNLEAMAQAIFKEWFGKSEKLKAKSEKLFKLGKIICGKTPSKSNLKYFGGEIPFIKIPDMHNQMFILKTEDSLTEVGADSQKNKFIPRNSICVSCIATVGLVSITTKDSQTNQQINTIIPKSESYLEFLYLALKTIKNDLMLIGSGGSTTLNINTSIFSNIEILVPEEEVIDKFHKLANPMFNKILQINKENQELATLRDLLLPKLMSGEIV